MEGGRIKFHVWRPPFQHSIFSPSGFATFLEQKGKDAVDPEVSSEERFQLEGVHASMALDAVPAMTVPVQYDIPNTRYDVRKRTPKKDLKKHFG